MCEFFSCTPAEAGVQDIALCRRIMELRAYRDAWAKIEAGVPQDELGDSPTMQRALLVQIAINRGEV